MPDLEPPVFADRFDGFQWIAGRFVPGWGGVLPPAIAPALQSWIVANGQGGYKLHYDDARLMGTGEATIYPAESYKLPMLAQSWRRVNPIITYRNLSAPMLIIDPTGDAFSPTEDFEKLRAMHPDLIRVVEYPDTLHAAHPMRPEWFVRGMTELLQQISGTH